MTSYPPDGWNEYGDGSWGGNCARNTSVVRSGSYSVEFKDDGQENVGMISDYISIQPGQPINVYAWVQADDVSAGHDVYLAVRWYTAAKGGIGAAEVVFQGELTDADAWQYINKIVTSPSTAGFFRIVIERLEAGFRVCVDECDWDYVPLGFKAYRETSNLSLGGDVGGTVTHLDFNAEAYDYGGLYDHSVNYQFVAAEYGPYLFSTLVVLVGGAYTGSSSAYLYQSFDAGVTTRYLDKIYPKAGGSFSGLRATWTELLSPGDTVDLYVWHNDDTELYLWANDYYSFFSATLLRP